MFCPMCGKQLKNNTGFCPYCGFHIQGSPPGSQNTYRNLENDSTLKQPWQTQEKNLSNGNFQQPFYGTTPYQGQQIARRTINTKLLAVIAVVLIVLTAMIYFLFFQSGKPEDTIQKLEGALNEMNQAEVSECFDTQTQSLYSGALGIGENLTGIDLQSLSELSTGLGGLFAASGLTPKFNINIQDITYSDSDTCLVTAQLTINYEGEQESEKIELPMRKKDREWLISINALSQF